MKKTIVTLSALVLSVLALTVSAQKRGTGTSYVNALGLRVDFGDGGTLVGFSGKHFFSPTGAGEAYVLFGNHTTLIGAEYQYHGAIQNAAGLKWNVGLGPNVAFYEGGGSNFFIRPMLGLDYKIANVPLNLGFDWRPLIRVTHGSDFEPARFGLAFRFTL